MGIGTSIAQFAAKNEAKSASFGRQVQSLDHAERSAGCPQVQAITGEDNLFWRQEKVINEALVLALSCTPNKKMERKYALISRGQRAYGCVSEALPLHP